uniref:Olfactory receptor n=1 Tax=Ursus maritimus TaxID=29073 RepID=A0A452VBU3_URSMA
MDTQNQTTVTEFTLTAFPVIWKLQISLFVVLLFTYMLTLTGNTVIISLIWADNRLQTPMYFFLSNLSFLDISYTTSVTPKLLACLLEDKKNISFAGCLTQIYFFFFLGTVEFILLAVMAYDRYVAISQPLRYTLIMNRTVCGLLMVASWVGGFIHSIVQVGLTIQLPFCGPDKLDNFYCDVPQLIKLACTDTFVLELLMVSNNGLVTLMCFLVLLGSYTALLFMLRGHSREGRSKALSTCASHIAVVTLIFVPCVYIYARPFRTFPMDKAVSVLYTMVTPMLNPAIYTLRNKEVIMAMKKLWRRQKDLLGPLDH